MKVLISILIVVGLILLGWRAWDYWQKIEQQRADEEAKTSEIVSSNRLPGLPRELQQELREKEKRGAEGLKQFLDQWSHLVKDPRLAAIELDYVVAISGSDPIEAKRLFAKVKKRIPPDSPLYPRIQALEKTYE